MRNIQTKALIAVCLGILLSGMLWAQSDFGSISGYIKDPSGATVPGAAVTVSNQSGLRRQAKTDSNGFYSIPNLPPGYYTMTAEATGFQKFVSNNNKLDPSGRLALNAALQVGATTQTVEVTA